MDEQIQQLEQQIAALPVGYISKKLINGKVYFYHQWTETGKKKSVYLKGDEAEHLDQQIKQRKQLQEQLKALRADKSIEKATSDPDAAYTLMHKSVPVVHFTLDTATNHILHITDVLHPEHLPVSVSVRRGIVDRQALNDWWLGRSIPASRSGVRQALETLQIANPQILLTKCFGLSLSDQYWIKPVGTDLKWEDINFFDHPFSEDLGDILLGRPTNGKVIDLNSPDNTSDGFLKKRWKIFDSQRCLLKSGSNPFMQQPFNEVVATAVMRRLGIPHVPYTVLWDNGTPYSVCEDFIDRDTELVSARSIMQTQKRGNSTSVYRHFIDCCEALGVPGIIHAVDQMIVLDYIIANEDRHQNNFGVVRDANTLKMLGFAPIFDSGSSLGYDKLTTQIRSSAGIECNPFKKIHEEQLKLVTDFSWIDFSRLEGMEDEVREIFAGAGEYMENNRIDAIVASMQKRIKHVRLLSIEMCRDRTDDIDKDVKENIAEDYFS